MKKAVIYKRVSTLVQVGEGASLDMQDERLRAYIKAQGWKLVDIYEDAGLSGKDTNRPEYQRMFKDANKGKFDCIVVYKLDRLSRSVIDFHELDKKLNALNVSIVSVTQNLDTSTSIGRLLRNILIDFANFEREMIVERSMESKYRLAKKGQWLGGRSPFGYKIINKKLIINPENAEIVKRIYKDYINGYTMRQLVSKYRIDIASIGVILRNPVYTGYIGYSKTNQVKGRTGKMYKQRKPVSEWILAEGQHEAIISMDEWKKVQRIKKSRVRHPGSRDNPQIFQGLCYCGNCGNKLYFFTNRSILSNNDVKYYYYYRCYNVNRVNPGTCEEISVSESAIEKAILNVLSDLLDRDEFWNNIKSTGKDNVRNEFEEHRKKHKAEHTRNKRKISSLVEKMVDADIKDIAHLLKPEVLKLEERQGIIQNELDEIDDQLKNMPSIDESMEIIRDVKLNWGYLSREEKRVTVHILLKKITVWNNKIELEFNDSQMPVIPAKLGK